MKIHTSIQRLWLGFVEIRFCAEIGAADDVVKAVCRPREFITLANVRAEKLLFRLELG